jgi:2-oxoglutarate ferredoxin oxidoreductase subunit beta
MMAQMLALMEGIPGLPTPLGVFRAVDRPTYERQLNEQVEAQKALKTLTIQEVLESGETWTVSGP